MSGNLRNEYKIDNIPGSSTPERVTVLSEKIHQEIWHLWKGFQLETENKTILFLNVSFSTDPMRYQEYEVLELISREGEAIRCKTLDSYTIRDFDKKAMRRFKKFVLSIFNGTHEVVDYYTNLPDSQVHGSYEE